MANVVITPANVSPTNTNTTLHLQPGANIAGQAIPAGSIVCQKESDGLFYLADANDTDLKTPAGIAANTAEALGQRIDVIYQTPSLEVGAHSQAVGTALFLSATAGKLCPYADLTSGDTPTLMAYAASATALQIIIAQSLNPKP